MATRFSMTRDINSFNGFGLQFTDTAYSATLAATTDTTLTVPSGDSMGGGSFPADNKPRLIAIFSFDPGEAVWVAIGATAAVPAGASFAATSSSLNPAAREVKGGDVLHFFTSASNVVVGVEFYWLT